jgi:adsorption protein B
MIPSAGVGTGVSRRALEELAARHNNEPFSTKSVTEDYEFGIRVAQLQLEGIFAKFRVVRTESVRRGIWRKREEIREVRELVATREFFPDRMALAVRQKSRWILGIALQGWKNIGWPKGFSRKYMLFRDRKSLATNLINVLGYTTLVYWSFVSLTRPGLSSSLLNQYHWVAYVIVVDTILMFHRWLQRFVAVKSIADTKQAFLSIPRSVLLNFINFAATMVALKQFLSSELSGKSVVWAKTSHAYPDTEQLREYRRKLGDLLLENRLITVAQLRHALDDQRASGRKLGSLLVQRGYLAEEDLVSALGRQLRVPSCEIDLRAIDTSVLEKLPQNVAEGLEVLPLRRSDGYLEVATTTPADENLKKRLEGLFDSPVKFILAGEKDLQFMIPRAYLRRAFPKQPLLGETLIAAGLITEEDLRKALKAQKAAGRKLGEVLQDMNLVTPQAIQECLGASCVLCAQNGGF